MNSNKSKPAGLIASAIDTNPIDVYVGRRIAMSCETMGLSRESLESLLGIDAGSLHCYEQGFLPMPEEVLYALSKIVRVPLRFFFEHDSQEAAA